MGWQQDCCGSGMLADIRFGLRNLFRQPGFLAVTVLTLALGIGANTAIFSVVKSVLLDPLPYPNAERLVTIGTTWKKTDRLGSLSGPDYRDLERRAQTLEAVSYVVGGEMGIRVGEVAEFAPTYLVTPHFFRVFAIRPAAGRLLNEDDEKAAVISYALAERHFGNVAAAIGRRIRFSQDDFVIVGVASRGFQYPLKAEAWLLFDRKAENRNRTAHNYRVVGLVKHGVEVAQAHAEVHSIGEALAREYAKENGEKGLAAVALKDRMVRDSRVTLYLLMGAVGLLMLIVCANMANLLLARATVRVREMAVRAAVGASRARLIRQLLIESSILALIGALGGILIAIAGVDALVALAPENTPRLEHVRVDARVLLFALALGLLASLIFGAVPAWQASRVDLNSALKQGMGKGVLGGASHRLRGALVIAELAVSLVLALGAGLLFRGFLALNQEELGFETSQRLVMYAHFPAQGLSAHLKAVSFFRDLLPQLKAIPGVTSAASVMGLPAGKYGSNGAYQIEGRAAVANWRMLPQSGFRLSSPGYFETLGIPLRRGRDFSDFDHYDGEFVAIVSEALVKQSFGGQDPIGQRVRCGLDSDKWMRIVGVVGDVRSDSPGERPQPELYMPVAQHPFFANELQLVLKTNVPAAQVLGPARQLLQRLNPEVPVKATTLEEMVSDAVALPRFRTTLLIVFATIAIALAMIGIYGVISYLVAQRAAEFGLRLALGAEASDILRLVLRHGVTLIATGFAGGLALAIASSRLIESMLYQVKPNDPLTYAIVLAGLGGTGLMAMLLPAWRAGRVDPIRVLRQE